MWDWVIWCAMPVVLTASSTVYMGAHRSRAVRKMMEGVLAEDDSEEAMGQQAVLDGRGALMMPVVGSITLLAFFFLFGTLQMVVVAYIVLASLASVTFVAHDHVRRAMGWLGASASRVTVQWACMGVSGATVLAWLYTGHWSLNNTLGCSITVCMISFVRLPNLRVAALCLGSLFLYDVFFVFGSAHVFGRNVMVEVATKAAVNPAAIVGRSLGLPSAINAAPSLQLPLKLLFPYFPMGVKGPVAFSMLGLGDMAIPGLLVALALAFDDYLQGGRAQALKRDEDLEAGAQDTAAPAAGAHRPLGLSLVQDEIHGLLLGADDGKPTQRLSYMATAMVGYVAGLLTSLVFSRAFRAAQPALLYLVPCTLGPVAMKAWRAGEGHLWLLWNGFEEEKQDTHADSDSNVAGKRAPSHGLQEGELCKVV